MPKVLLASLLAVFTSISAVAQETIPWITDLSQARRIAEQQQRLVLLHFWGDGCQPCQQLEANVFNQPELIRAVATNFVPVKIHVQQQPAIANYYKIDKIPTDIVVLPSGVQVFRTTSPGNANTYIAMLDQVRANALANGFQEASRVARNVMQQVAPILPSLPPRNPEEAPATQSVSGELSANDPAPSGPQPGWRNAVNGLATAAEQVRGSVQNNEFVGPLDRKAQSTSAPTGPRYGNPYVNDSPPANPTTSAPAVAEPTSGAPPVGPSAIGASGTSALQPAAAAGPATQSMPSNSSVASPPVDQRPNQFVPAAPGSSNTSAPSAPAVPAWAATAPAPVSSPPTQQSDSLPSGPPSNSFSPAGAPPSSPSPAPTPNSNAVQLPPGVPPLALDGYCPVTLMNLGKWEKGDPRFGAVHRDRTYLFKSQVERDRFLAPAAADRFAPVLSGLDPVRFAESGQAVQGRREHGVLFDGQIFLFADEEALVRFEQQPQRYVAVVRQAMASTRNVPPQR